jgi:hypothetical protein
MLQALLHAFRSAPCRGSDLHTSSLLELILKLPNTLAKAEDMNRNAQIPARAILSALTLSAALVGCATPIRTDPVITDGQERIFRDGLPALVSRKQYIVLVSPTTTVREGKERLRLIVSVANTSTTSFDLDTSNFSAMVDGRPLKIFTHDEIAQEIRTRQARAAFAVALGGAMQAASAQQQASYASTSGTYNSNTTGNFNAYGNRSNVYGNYNATTSGTYSGWAYNPAAGQAAAAAINAKTDADMARLQANGQGALNEAARTMLKQTTVFPQSNYGGQIMLGEFEVPETGSTLELIAKVQDEMHTFQFTQQRQK